MSITLQSIVKLGMKRMRESQETQGFPRGYSFSEFPPCSRAFQPLAFDDTILGKGIEKCIL